MRTSSLGPHGFPNSLLTLLQQAGAPTVTIDGQQYYFSHIARSSAYMNYVYNQLSVANAGLSLGAIQLV